MSTKFYVSKKHRLLSSFYDPLALMWMGVRDVEELSLDDVANMPLSQFWRIVETYTATIASRTLFYWARRIVESDKEQIRLCEDTATWD